MPEASSRLGHLPDGAAAVRPVGVDVAVPSQRLAQGDGVGVELVTLGGLEPSQVRRHLAPHRLGDRQGGHLADSRKRFEPLLIDETLQLGLVESLDGSGGAPEGADAIGRLPSALEEKGDPLQGVDSGTAGRRGHRPVVPGAAWRALWRSMDTIVTGRPTRRPIAGIVAARSCKGGHSQRNGLAR